MQKGNRLVLAINIIMLLLATVLIGFIVTILVLGDPTNRMVSCISTLALYLLPVLLKWLLKLKIPASLWVIYFVFVTLGAFCGSCLNLTHTLQGFDKVQHSMWGYISCFVGLYYLCATKEFEKVNVFTVILLFLGISLATAGLWELLEFAGDNLLGQTAQGKPVGGIVPVNDAMFDILCHTCGSIVFTIHFCLDRCLHKNLGITWVINDFSKK